MQVITINLIENFNNNNFRASALRVTLANSSLVFTDAVLKIRPSLFGIRYLMRRWFFTTALIFVSIFSTFVFFTFVAFFLVVRRKVREILIKLYPPAGHYRR